MVYGKKSKKEGRYNGVSQAKPTTEYKKKTKDGA